MLTNNNKGSALVVALIIMVLVTAFSVSYTQITMSQNELVTTSLDFETANQSANAGFDMSRVVLTTGHDTVPLGWDDELTACISNKASYDPGASPLTVDTSTSGFQWYRKISYAGGYFIAEITNNTDGGGAADDRDDTIILTINAVLSNGKEAQIQALIRYKPPIYEPQNAVETNGTLGLSGNVAILGDQGSIYANDNIEISGSSSVAQDVYSTGTINNKGTVGGGTYPGSPATDVPSISPTQYASLADYELRVNGDVYSTTGMVVVGTATKFNEVLGWKYDGGQWQYNSNVSYNGTYYVLGDKDVWVGGSPGSDADPWDVTLLVTGDVTIKGSPVMAPDSTGVVLLAGKDLVVAGGGRMKVVNGLVAAHEQIGIQGTLDLTGVLVAEDGPQTVDSLIEPGGKALDVEISGNVKITYNGGLTTFLQAGDPYLKVLGFKKLK